jgi:hypothetical protein
MKLADVRLKKSRLVVMTADITARGAALDLRR